MNKREIISLEANDGEAKIWDECRAACLLDSESECPTYSKEQQTMKLPCWRDFDTFPVSKSKDGKITLPKSRFVIMAMRQKLPGVRFSLDGYKADNLKALTDKLDVALTNTSPDDIE